MDKISIDTLRRKKLNIEDFGDLGALLLGKANQGPAPIYKNKEAVAMVIEIKQFDQEWQFCGAEVKQKECTLDENELLYLLQQQVLEGDGC